MAGRTAIKVCFVELQLVGAIALHPVVCSLAGLMAEVQGLLPVRLPLITVGAILGIPLGHHAGVCSPVTSEGHHQLGRTCTHAYSLLAKLATACFCRLAAHFGHKNEILIIR